MALTTRQRIDLEAAKKTALKLERQLERAGQVAFADRANKLFHAITNKLA